MAGGQKSLRQLTRRTFVKGAGAAGLLAGTGLQQVLFPALWRQTGASPLPPFGLHLQFGSEPAREMAVSWLTDGAVAHPRVRFGTSLNDLDGAESADTRTYIDGLSRTEVFTQHAFPSRLHPNATYHYEVLHDGADPVRGQFQTAPSGRSRFRFTSFGDQSIPAGLGNPPTLPWTRYAGLIVPQVEAARPLFHLLNGDLCYANVAGRKQLRVQTWRSFFNNNTRSARYRPWMPAAGNHENERLDGRPGADPFKAYQTYFDLPESESAGLSRSLVRLPGWLSPLRVDQ